MKQCNLMNMMHTCVARVQSLGGAGGAFPWCVGHLDHIFPSQPTPCANITSMCISPCTLHASTPHVLQHVALTYTNMHGECGVAGTGANACKAPSPSQSTTHFHKHALVESHGNDPNMHSLEVLEQSKACPWPSIVQCMLPPKEEWSG